MDWPQKPWILQKAIEAQLLSSLMDDRTSGIWLLADTQTWKFNSGATVNVGMKKILLYSSHLGLSVED